MNTSRLEAFSDGVIAIIITIMVLDLHVPHDVTFAALRALWPTFLSYLFSFIFVGIYWNNHHHLLQPAERVSGPVLWANLHLLFWLSLVPFVTAWMGENHFAAPPVALYGMVLLGSAIAFSLLAHLLIRLHGDRSVLAIAIGRDRKGFASLALYVLAVPLAFFRPALSLALYAAVAILWLVPDPRIEKALKNG